MSKPNVWAILTTILAAALLAVACAGGATGQIKNARLEVGDKAPDFRLPDHTGGYVGLSDFQGEKNVVLAFYPLAWTPV
jgi:peroxiredoxin